MKKLSIGAQKPRTHYIPRAGSRFHSAAAVCMVTDHPRDPRSPSYGGRAANTTPARGISPPDISDSRQCYWVFGLPPPDVLSARLVVRSSCALPGAWMATLIVALPAFLSFPQVGRQVIRDPGFFYCCLRRHCFHEPLDCFQAGCVPVSSG